MPEDSRPHSFAVFPFLKTSRPFTVGNLTLRSTEDTADLTPEQAGEVREISDMLFLQDNFRIRSATYAKVPLINFSDPNEDSDALEDLAHLQAILAYCYSAPHPVSFEPSLRYEHVSLAIFSPERFSIYLLQPQHHVDWVGPSSTVVADNRGEVAGYSGLYNFKHHFWVSNGSRLYPPTPHLGLNISQSTAADFDQFMHESSHYPLLLGLFAKPRTATSERILRAIDWFNSGNSLMASEEESMISLAVAFEALLGISDKDEKKKRLVDAIWLLLGRVPRLEKWVTQFYDARSDIVHEGQMHNPRFIAKGPPDVPLYHSLLAFGRVVFQLCVGALLFGAGVAERAGLQEKLVTSKERLDEINKELSDDSVAAADRLRGVTSKVQTLDRYSLAWDLSFNPDTILCSIRLASKALLECDDGLDVAVKERLGRIVSANRSDQYEILDAVRELNASRAQGGLQSESRGPRAIVFRLMHIAWMSLFPLYFQLEKRRDKGTQREDGGSD